MRKRAEISTKNGFKKRMAGDKDRFNSRQQDGKQRTTVGGAEDDSRNGNTTLNRIRPNLFSNSAARSRLPYHSLLSSKQ